MTNYELLEYALSNTEIDRALISPQLSVDESSNVTIVMFKTGGIECDEHTQTLQLYLINPSVEIIDEGAIDSAIINGFKFTMIRDSEQFIAHYKRKEYLKSIEMIEQTARAYGTLYVSEDTMIVSYDDQTNTVSVFTDDEIVKIKPRQNVKVMQGTCDSDPTILIIGETVFKNVELSEEFDEMLELFNGKIVMGMELEVLNIHAPEGTCGSEP